MSIHFNLPVQEKHLKPRITVIGIGGAGGNAVNNMIECGLEGIEFVACNTDAQALEQSIAERKIQLGPSLTQGLGAGSRPDIGRAAAEEVIDALLEQLAGANMIFLAAGMGGGTGTGATPVIARAAKEQDILTVGVVTKPFNFEGITRMRVAEEGIQELQQFVDTLIVIPNQNLFRVADEKTTFAQAFAMADDVLQAGVRGITDLMVKPGLINLDFADIRAVMAEMGKAQMGTGECEGDNRAVQAAEAAISNPILEDSSMKGAHGMLINITGGSDMTMFEVDEAANRIKEEVDSHANIIFGAAIDDSMAGRIRVSMVATGIEAGEERAHTPHHLESDVRAFLPQSQPDTQEKTAEIRHLTPPNPQGKDASPPQPHRLTAITAGQNPEPSADMASRQSLASHETEFLSPMTDDPATIPPAPKDRVVSHASRPAVSSGPEEENHRESKPTTPVSLFKRMTRSRVKQDHDSQPALYATKEPAVDAQSPPGQKQGKEEDLLEIPAFLRRQAN